MIQLLNPILMLLGALVSFEAVKEIRSRTLFKSFSGSQTESRTNEESLFFVIIGAITATVLGLYFLNFSLGVSPNSTEAALLFGSLAIFGLGGIYLTIVDLKLQILPTKDIYFFGTIGIVLLALSRIWVSGDLKHLIPLLIGGGFYFGAYFLLWFLLPNAIGAGDVRLALPLGALLGAMGADALIVGMASPFLLATLGILVYLIFYGKPPKQIAFGPWMLLGALVAIFYGPMIVSFIKP